MQAKHTPPRGGTIAPDFSVFAPGVGAPMSSRRIMPIANEIRTVRCPWQPLLTSDLSVALYRVRSPRSSLLVLEAVMRRAKVLWERQ
jgi:hypothetical protein